MLSPIRNYSYINFSIFKEVITLWPLDILKRLNDEASKREAEEREELLRDMRRRKMRKNLKKNSMN